MSTNRTQTARPSRRLSEATLWEGSSSVTRTAARPMRRIVSHRLTAALLCYGLVCSSGGGLAQAQPVASAPANEEMAAATLFELGVSLVETKRFDEALGAFDLA